MNKQYPKVIKLQDGTIVTIKESDRSSLAEVCDILVELGRKVLEEKKKKEEQDKMSR